MTSFLNTNVRVTITDGDGDKAGVSQDRLDTNLDLNSQELLGEMLIQQKLQTAIMKETFNSSLEEDDLEIDHDY